MDQPCKVCQSCLWSTEQGKWIFPCPRPRLRIWPRETGSAVPSRVSPLIPPHSGWIWLVGAYSRDSSRFPRRRPFIYTATRHRVGPESIGSRNLAYRQPSVPRVHRHRASIPQGGSSNECCLCRPWAMSWCVVRKVSEAGIIGSTTPCFFIKKKKLTLKIA